MEGDALGRRVEGVTENAQREGGPTEVMAEVGPQSRPGRGAFPTITLQLQKLPVGFRVNTFTAISSGS